MARASTKHELPRLESFDNAHAAMGSSTLALELQADRLKGTKRSRWRNHEARILDMVRTLGEYRREIQFFRTVHSGTDALLLGIRSVVQQMILNYYLRPELDGVRDEQWLELSEELDQLLQDHASTAKAAETDWLNLSAQNMVIDHSSKF